MLFKHTKEKVLEENSEAASNKYLKQ